MVATLAAAAMEQVFDFLDTAITSLLVAICLMAL